ncbi:hypothetical protein HHL16_16295 [Pseudoflavitalea sp. G-6-1-2]|uniref:RteC domain-containing protein n=1 Tax=Pseudoflavitalea sp. G-6-1-2 TaxID=2728841 RepID=UPI00146CC61C|nr:RteC domain-containing protein [Pseudoflavitalea sp. G-6-1-2]NML22446.1 hypothetical protein [Pseudoflavitalea sp. G-6-1-2]
MQSLLQSSELLLSTLHEQLAATKATQSTPLLQSKAAIPVCLEHVRILRKHLKAYRNVPRDQEIHFFRYIKPQFVSQYLFHVLQYRLHYSWPKGDVETEQLYLEEELNHIRRFFKKNHQFCCYYSADSIYLDNIYFLRGQQDVEPSPEHLICGTDPSFNTPKDLLVARVIANNLFRTYLHEQLVQLQSSKEKHSRATPASGLTWTASKSALMEVIYAVYLTRAVNGGNCEIKALATVICNIFNVEINYNSIYDFIYHLKLRKLEPTKYTDQMRTCLLQSYDNQTEKPDKSRYGKL